MANFPVVSMTRRELEGEDLQLAVICGWPNKTASTLVSSMTAEERDYTPRLIILSHSLKYEDIKVD